jgi:hypothetical protein
LVLLGLRLAGIAESEALVDRTGFSITDLQSALAAALEEGLVVRREGRLQGYQLTTAGRADLDHRLSRELNAAGAGAVLRSVYEQFRPLNQRFLELCTRWQLRPNEHGETVVNDHTDPDYDAAAVADLAQIHRQATPVVSDLAGALDRYGRYEPLLTTALSRVRAGEVDYFTKPMIPSYHTVWFELHEDLLATLGIERSSEGT